MRQRRSRPRLVPTRLVPILVIALAGCTGSSGGTGSHEPLPPSVATTPGPSPTAGAATVASSPSVIVEPSAGDLPPDARLASEGGEPVTGELGTFIWGDGGSDSPWLPGAPLHVGAGERLTLTLSPAIGIVGWRTQYTRAGATDLTGARSLGSGTGDVALTAPVKGDWTLAIAVDFADGLGSANYFWRLEVG